MDIRLACARDAAAICRLIRRSIVELCARDHGDDPSALSDWLANKTPDNVAAWIGAAENSMLVAVEHDDFLGVGCINRQGEILLNYVAPEARFRGVSRRLLAEMEASAVASGLSRIMLISTLTALYFYRSNGYREVSAPETTT